MSGEDNLELLLFWEAKSLFQFNVRFQKNIQVYATFSQHRSCCCHLPIIFRKLSRNHPLPPYSSHAGLLPLTKKVTPSSQNSARKSAIHLPGSILIAPDGAPAIRGAPKIARIGKSQLTASHQMDDDAVAQLAEHVDVSVIEVGASDLPDLGPIVTVLHNDGNAGGGLVLGYVDAAARAFDKTTWSAIFGRDCNGDGDGDERDELENEPCQAGGGEKLHCG